MSNNLTKPELKSLIKKNDEAIKGLTYQVGEQYVANYFGGEVPSCADFFAQIAKLKEENQIYESRLTAGKDAVICTKCGLANSKDANFCIFCGQDLSIAKEPLTEKDITAENLCSNCKAPIQVTDAFCTNCGTPSGISSEPTSKKCPTCNKENSLDSAFCVECGAAL